MFGPKIKISKALLEKLKAAAETSGCVSAQEFAERTLEREADKVLSRAGKNELSQKEVEDIANKLKGLGYLE